MNDATDAMPRAAIVTGGSSGIGLAIAEVLGDEGYGITICSRRAEKLAAAAEQLRSRSREVQEIACNVAAEDEIKRVVASHRERYGRLDVLVNNAGVGVGSPVGDVEAKRLDIQIAVNVRSVVLFYRECVEMLRAAARERGSALVVNMASISGLRGQAWLGVYSATKHAVVGFTEAMNKELGPDGVKSTAICPALVDTDMTAFARGRRAPEKMIRTEDVAGAVRWLLHTSANCVVPEIPMSLPGDEVF